LNDEDNDVWRLHCVRKLAEEVLGSDLLSSAPTYKTKLKAFYHAWNPEDCSRNIYVKPNGFTIHRNPVAQSTDAVRGKIGFSHGRHAWEVMWEGPLGTVAVVGIATKEASLQVVFIQVTFQIFYSIFCFYFTNRHMDILLCWVPTTKVGVGI